MEQQLVLTRVKSRWHELVGEFQPLSWYTARGYDTSTFSVDAPAEWNDDMGCMTYKIGIHKTGDRSQEEIARTEMLKIIERVNKKPTAKALEYKAKESDGGESAETSPSSSSESSSSSSSGKKDKTGKKDKKH